MPLNITETVGVIARNSSTALEMAEHFLRLHARPEEICPHDSEDGYHYLWGGPVYAWDWLENEYPNYVGYQVLEDAHNIIDPESDNGPWARKPSEATPTDEELKGRRQFFKTVFTVEILSEQVQSFPVNMDLREVLDEADAGDFSGFISDVKVTTLTAPEVAKELIRQGSAPEFFGLNEDGTDVKGGL